MKACQPRATSVSMFSLQDTCMYLPDDNLPQRVKPTKSCHPHPSPRNPHLHPCSSSNPHSQFPLFGIHGSPLLIPREVAARRGWMRFHLALEMDCKESKSVVSGLTLAAVLLTHFWRTQVAPNTNASTSSVRTAFISPARLM